VTDVYRTGRLAEPRRRFSRAETRSYLFLCIAGILVGLAWRLLGPGFAAAGVPSERGIAVDGTLALLQLLAGLVTGGLLIAHEGDAPVRRGLLGIGGSLIAGGLSLLTGLVAGGPVLQSPAAALVWPVITAVVVFTGTLIAMITVDRHERHAPAHPPNTYATPYPEHPGPPPGQYGDPPAAGGHHPPPGSYQPPAGWRSPDERR
jgi:hypothetical protein